MQNNFIPGSPDKKTTRPFFEIHSMEQLTQRNLEQLANIHQQQYFQIAWLLQGSVNHVLNQQQHLLTGNTIHIAIPGQQQQLFIADDSKGFLIVFNEALLIGCYEDFNCMQEISFFRNFSQCGPMQVGDDLIIELRELVIKMQKENESDFASKNEILSKYLKIFLIYVRRQFEMVQQQRGTANNSLFNNFIWLLENNFKEKKAVAEYAMELSVTPSYLNHVIKKTSGYPASYHIQQRIVLEAKRKVRYTGASMKEVAYYLGFDDISHFSKFFKSSCGMNFTTFKNSSHEVRA